MNINNLYKKQSKHMDSDLINVQRERIHKSWFEEDTVDFWRHDRMYEMLRPVAEYYPKSKWLSVGDGRFGLDSIRLRKKFGINAFPTDISEAMLQHSKDKGLIEDFSVQNAEALDFEDQSYDFVFCKECLHHCPRPMVAISEMIRVANSGIILIEPQDCKSTVEVEANFESAGNYVYALSNREINKLVHSMNLSTMAYLEFNDAYLPGVEFEKANSESKIFHEIKQMIKQRDEQINFSYTCTIIFKNQLDQNLKKSLLEHGFKIPIRHKNPYLT
jgi:ubiquinone/menaquinone biosynthesis C-methylase UbiE